MKWIHSAPPTTEAELMIQAAPVLERLGGRLPEPADLVRMTAEKGFEVASMVLYRALEIAPLHQSYQGFLRRYDTEFRKENDDFTVLILSEAPFLLQPTWQNPQRRLDQIAFQAGFRTEVIARPRNASQYEWGQRLREHLAALPKSLVLTYGVGSAVARQVLLRENARDEFENLAGWVNLSGGVGGYDLYQQTLRTAWGRIGARVQCGLHWTSFSRIREGAVMARFQGADRVSLPWKWPIVSVYGVSLGPGLHGALRSGFRKLRRLGPTDGVNAWASLLGFPGAFIPCFGQDARLSGFLGTTVLRKILCSMAESAGQRVAREREGLMSQVGGEQTRLDLSL